MTESDALLVLNAVPGLGNAGIKKLVSHFSSASRVLEASAEALTQSRSISPQIARNIFDFPKDKFLKAEYNLIAREGVDIITLWDERYPQDLAEIPDAPVVLYVKGNLKSCSGLRIAIVGSRRASFYGIETAEKLAAQLAEMGFTIVSGLAKGIDAAAHRGCLKVRVPTWAVTGNGLAHIYPSENKDLYEDIAANGAVISEFPMDKPPIPINFPQRNRIISGLSMGVVVVEAAARSGALITADFALEQGREVFAVPGKIDAPTAKGVHTLIKQGAKLITSVDDIVEELKLPISRWQKENAIDPASDSDEMSELSMALTSDEQAVFSLLSKQPVHLDKLVERSERGIAFVSPILLQLELKKRIKQLPGKLFVR